MNIKKTLLMLSSRALLACSLLFVMSTPCYVRGLVHNHEGKISRMINVGKLKFSRPGWGYCTFEAAAKNDIHLMFSSAPGVDTENRGFNTAGAGNHVRFAFGGYNNDRSWVAQDVGTGADRTKTSPQNNKVRIVGGLPESGEKFEKYWILVRGDGQIVHFGTGDIIGQNELMVHDFGRKAPDIQYVYFGGHDNAAVSFKNIVIGDLPTPEDFEGKSTKAVIKDKSFIGSYKGQDRGNVRSQALLHLFEVTPETRVDAVAFVRGRSTAQYTSAQLSFKAHGSGISDLAYQLSSNMGDSSQAPQIVSFMYQGKSQFGILLPHTISLTEFALYGSSQNCKFLVHEVKKDANTAAEFEKLGITNITVAQAMELPIVLPTGFAPEAGKLKTITLGSNANELEVWGIGLDNALYRFDRYSMAELPWTKQEAKLIDGTALVLEDIACASDGTMVGVNNAGKSFKYNWEAKNWDVLAMGAGNDALDLDQIAVGHKDCIWATDNDSSTVYEYTQDKGWVARAEGIATFVAAGVDGTVAALNKNGTPFLWKDSKWHRMDTIALETIAVGKADMIMGIDKNANLLEYKEGKFVAVKGEGDKSATGFDSIAMNAVGTVFLADADGDLYRKGDAAVAVTVKKSDDGVITTREVKLAVVEAGKETRDEAVKKGKVKKKPAKKKTTGKKAKVTKAKEKKSAAKKTATKGKAKKSAPKAPAKKTAKKTTTKKSSAKKTTKKAVAKKAPAKK